MKKRRVLAFLLALSLTVGTNGMTVLATEDGGTAVAEIVPEETVTDETQAESDQTDSEDSAEEEQEEQKQDEADKGETAEDGTGEDGPTDQEADNNETPDSETADGNAADADNAAPGDVENDAEDASDPADGIDSEEPEETSDVADDSILPDIIHEVRMVTFTDDTGMRITYDANASQQYIYTVEGGVLTKVERLTGEGETKEPVIFTGNVELTQPAEEEQQYTSIAAEIFAGNTDITYVKLPSGITTVTAGSFKGCTALKSVYLPATVTAIGESAFESCTAMSQIAVPKTTESIGNSAFKGDTKLYMVYAKDADYSSLASIGDHAFDGCIVLAEFCSDTEFRLPTNVTNIGEYAFHNCKSIAKIDLNAANLTTMGEYAFAGCTGLTDAVMNKSLPTIPKHAFEGCIALASLTFTSKSGQWVKIDEYAFYGCYSLKQLVLPGTISEVADYAFAGCTNLHRIEVKNDNLSIGKIRPFPVGETKNTLLFVGSDPSTIYDYYRTTDAGKDKVAFEKSNARNYYKYTVEDSNGVECKEGKVPGGQIWIGPKESNKYEDNINTLNNGKGVYNDDEVQYCVYSHANDGYTLVAGSLRANGEALQKEKDGYYYITMPLGGIVITAEFSQNTTERVEGQEKDIAVEFSNGELIMSGEEAIGVKIKVGQTTRMFLIDKSGVPVAASKIQEMKSDKESVAKVSGTGVITAVGRGTAFIRASLIGGDGREIVIQRRVDVVEAEVDTIKIKASEYDTLITITGDPDGIQTASVDKNVVRNEGLSITLRANAYTSDKEGISKDLTWKTSDSKIAKLTKDSTTGADAVNVVKIQPGCEGEATITVTAKNSGNEDKPTVTQKFVVSVQDKTAKLAYKSITVNPNLEDGGELEVLPAYGAAIEPTKTTLYEEDKDRPGQYLPTLKFSLRYKGAGSGKSYRYSVIPTPGIKDGTYKVYVCFNGANPDQSAALPLTITVKKSVPAPTVKFNTKKTKFNIFYKNGGTDKDGNPITVTAEVSKLGTAKIKKFELQALSTKDNDKLFLENFEIVDNPEELAKNTVTIRRKAGDLKYTSGKKAAVTGNLVIYYEGYSDAAAKKVKVTMPTTTTAPSYVLDRTSVTYRNSVLSAQQETLTLLDKKTRKPIELDSTRNRIDVDTDISVVNSCAIDANGDITFGMSYPEKGKIKFILQSDEWNTDKEGKPRTLTYTFNVKISDKEPTVKTDQKMVTLNAAYPENKAYFRLVSNQSDTVLWETQIFDYNRNAPNASEYSKMSVNYSDGLGTVEIIEPNANIKAGTYTWTAYPVEKNGNVLAKKTTLTVKVVKTPPAVKFGQGSLSLNLAAGMSPDNQNVIYTETATIPFTITGQPEGYELDTNVNTGGECTTIVCTTSNESGREDRFSWALEGVKKVDDKLVDGKLAVSLKSGVASKTYTFKMTQRYVNSSNGNAVLAKPITFKVKVYSNSDISVSLSTQGKLNLVDREGEYTSKNSIIYTPTLKNVKGVITDARIYDFKPNSDDDGTKSESKYFDIYLNPENGKLYVTPKKIKVSTPGDPDTGKPDDNVPGDDTGSGGNIPGDDAGSDDTVSGNDVESDGSDTNPDGSMSGNDTDPGNGSSGNDTEPGSGSSGSGTEPGSGSSGSGTESGGNTSGEDTKSGGDSSGGSTEPGGNTSGSDVKSEYLYAGLENNKKYTVQIWVGVEGYSGKDGSGGILSKPIDIKTAQTLPKVTKSKTTLDVFLSNKGYDASFVVTPKAGSAGQIESIHFGEKDLISQDTFQILYERQKDGSLKVIVHLKEAVAYACDSTNQVKMYVRFKGQGTNTDGTPITMNIRINK